MPPPRRRAQDFLELVERSRRGRLKLYVGYAAGVGKTFRMLQEAHALKARGVDVAIAFVETHRRAETEALVAGLEVIPRKRLDYKGIVVEELDLEAVLARRPAVAIVDELAHTNAPGERNRKRYQDVETLLEAGINVLGAFNIQHLESLGDVLTRVSGIAVRETLPDRFLDEADQLVSLDLAVEDLLERLRAGKLYPPERVPAALGNFFAEDNLSALRELALREVAERVERAGHAREAPRAPTRARPATGRVMVCMASHPPHATALLRRGARMAGRLNTNWYVVYVATPDETPERIDATAQRHLLANIERARELGAEVVRLEGREPVVALLEFARTHGVSDLVVGRSRSTWWQWALGRAVLPRLLREAGAFDVHVVSLEPSDDPEESP